MNLPPDAPQLPPDLPPLPPVPEGFDRWDYRGRKWLAADVRFAYFCEVSLNGWSVASAPDKTLGLSGHYIEAVKSSPAVPAQGGEDDKPNVYRFINKEFLTSIRELSDKEIARGPCIHTSGKIMGKNELTPVTDTQRETPRTDALKESLKHRQLSYQAATLFESHEALERELTTARASIAKESARCNTIANKWVGRLKEAEDALTAAQDDSKRLNWTMKKLNSMLEGVRMIPWTRESIDDAMSRE